MPHGEAGVPVIVAVNQSIMVPNSPFLCSWILWIRNLGRAQLGGSCLGSLMKVKSDADWGCSHLKAWPGQSHGWQVGTSCWQGALVSLHTGLFLMWLEGSHDMATGFLRSDVPKRSRWKLHWLLRLSLGSHTFSLSPYSVGATGQPLFCVDGVYTGTWIPEANNHRDHPGGCCHMHHSQGGSRFTRRNGIGNQREDATSFPRFWNWRCQNVQPCSPKLWVSQYCPPCEIILKKRQKDPGVKAKLEMSNCHRCPGACAVPTPAPPVTSDSSYSCGGQLWDPTDCHLQCQIHFSSLPDAHLAPKHSPAQKNRGVSDPLTTGMRVKWMQTPSSLPF